MKRLQFVGIIIGINVGAEMKRSEIEGIIRESNVRQFPASI